MGPRIAIMVMATFGAMTAPVSASTVVVSPGGLAAVGAVEQAVTVVMVPGRPVMAGAAELGRLRVTDARGTGAGWSLTIQATRLRPWDGADYVPGAQALSGSSLTLLALAVAVDGTDSAPPRVRPGPYRLGATALTVARAAPGTGMGRYIFEPTGGLVVTVPAGAAPGTYRSEMSLSVVSGP